MCYPSGLVGRVQAVWGSFLFSIWVIFPLHQILSVAGFKLKTCFFLSAGLLVRDSATKNTCLESKSSPCYFQQDLSFI